MNPSSSSSATTNNNTSSISNGTHAMHSGPEIKSFQYVNEVSQIGKALLKSRNNYEDKDQSMIIQNHAGSATLSYSVGSYSSLIMPTMKESNPLKYADVDGFIEFTSLLPDIKLISDLEQMVEVAQEHASMLYTYRSCSSALNSAGKIAAASAGTSNPQQTQIQNEIHMIQFNVLRAEMTKILNLMAFKTEALGLLKRSISVICKMYLEKKVIISSYIYDGITSLLDSLVIIDELKDSKSALRNDFASYKRSYELVKSLGVDNIEKVPKELDEIKGFLNDASFDKSAIFHQIKRDIWSIQTEMAGISESEIFEIIYDVFEFCVEKIDPTLFDRMEKQHYQQKLPYLFPPEQYVFPEEKFRYIRMLPYLALIMHVPEKNINVFKKSSARHGKLLTSPRVSNIFKKYPVLPLYCELCTSPFLVLKKCGPLFDAPMEQLFSYGGTSATIGGILPPVIIQNVSIPQGSNPSTAAAQLGSLNAPAVLNTTSTIVLNEADVKIRKQYELIHHWQSIRRDYEIFTSAFTEVMSRLQLFKQGSKVLDANDPLTQDKDSIEVECDVYHQLLRGIKLISTWKEMILLQAAFKYTNRAPPDRLAQLGLRSEDVSDYENVVRYNYTKAEIYVLVDVVSMIKSVANMLQRSEIITAPAARRHMYGYLQEFIQVSLKAMLSRAERKKRNVAPLLVKLSNLAGDWERAVKGLSVASIPVEKHTVVSAAISTASATSNSSANTEDPDSTGPGTTAGSSSSSSDNSIPVFGIKGETRRCVSGSNSQLLLLRYNIECMYDERAEGMIQKNIFNRSKDFNKGGVNLLAEFLHESFFFTYMSNLRHVVSSLSNLGDLWLRESYIEYEWRNGIIQFPISMSLPWIMMKEVIDDPTGDMVESVFYILDIYNDAAECSLRCLKKQHLYNEVESELDLVFQQLIFLISNNLYSYFKSVSALKLIDKVYRDLLRDIRGRGYLDMRKRKYEVALMKQRTIILLGRQIDVSDLLARAINEHIRNDVDFAIQRFEITGLWGAPELVNILKIIKGTHGLLTTQGSFNLDSFELILSEIDARVSPGSSFRGRIVDSIVNELLQDLATNLSYNHASERFVRPLKGASVIGSGNGTANVAGASDTTGEESKSGQSRSLKAKNKERKQGMPSSYLYGEVTKHAFEAKHGLEHSFIGYQHVDAIIELVGPVRLTTIVDKLVTDVEKKIMQSIAPFSRYIQENVPDIQLSKVNNTHASSCYSHLDQKLKTISDNQLALPEIFQSFREFGNIIAFIYLLQSSLNKKETLTFIHSSPYTGTENIDKMKLGPDVMGVPKIDDSPLVQNIAVFVEAAESEVMKRERQVCLDQARSAIRVHQEDHRRCVLLRNALMRLSDFIRASDELKTVWQGELAGDGNPITSVINQYSCDFRRVWSVIQFIFCLPSKTSQLLPSTTSSNKSKSRIIAGRAASIALPSASIVLDDNRADYGDGFAWGGCTLLQILGQRNRFEVLDFCYYIYQLNYMDRISVLGPQSGAGAAAVATTTTASSGGGVVDGGVSRDTLDSFIRKTHSIKSLNTNIFLILSKAMPHTTRDLVIFHPPGIMNDARQESSTYNPLVSGPSYLSFSTGNVPQSMTTSGFTASAASATSTAIENDSSSSSSSSYGFGGNDRHAQSMQSSLFSSSLTTVTGEFSMPSAVSSSTTATATATTTIVNSSSPSPPPSSSTLLSTDIPPLPPRGTQQPSTATATPSNTNAPPPPAPTRVTRSMPIPPQAPLPSNPPPLTSSTNTTFASNTTFSSASEYGNVQMENQQQQQSSSSRALPPPPPPPRQTGNQTYNPFGSASNIASQADNMNTINIGTDSLENQGLQAPPPPPPRRPSRPNT